MTKRSCPLSKVYGLLEPGPVVILTTRHKGRPNAMTLSWHTMLEFEPPLAGCVVSDRDHSYQGLDRPCLPGPAHAAPSGAWSFHFRRRHDPACVQDEINIGRGHCLEPGLHPHFI